MKRKVIIVLISAVMYCVLGLVAYGLETAFVGNSTLWVIVLWPARLIPAVAIAYAVSTIVSSVSKALDERATKEALSGEDQSKATRH